MKSEKYFKLFESAIYRCMLRAVHFLLILLVLLLVDKFISFFPLRKSGLYAQGQ
jgi:hypothetical protein